MCKCCVTLSSGAAGEQEERTGTETRRCSPAEGRYRRTQSTVRPDALPVTVTLRVLRLSVFHSDEVAVSYRTPRCRTRDTIGRSAASAAALIGEHNGVTQLRLLDIVQVITLKEHISSGADLLT